MAISFALQNSTISSVIELLYKRSINLSDTWTTQPKSLLAVVNCSFVWLLNTGLATVALKNKKSLCSCSYSYPILAN